MLTIVVPSCVGAVGANEDTAAAAAIDAAPEDEEGSADGGAGCC